jgi:D-alanine transaminase
VIGGVLRTHPADHLVLPGVTRDVVIEIARELGREVREVAIGIGDLPRATELFLTGTTTDVTPIVEIDGRPVGDGAPGHLTKMLRDRLLERMTAGAGILASSRG